MFSKERQRLTELDMRLAQSRAEARVSRERAAKTAASTLAHPATLIGLAVIAPFTLGALVAAASRYRKPRVGGRFAGRDLAKNAVAAWAATEGLRKLAAPHLESQLARLAEHAQRPAAEDVAPGD